MREIPYQNRVIADISDYLRQLEKTNSLQKAWYEYWNEKGIVDICFGFML